MSFMLREYDALPFGLLRHSKGKTPGSGLSSSIGSGEEAPMFVHCCPHAGQKVMPLDKVRWHIRNTFPRMGVGRTRTRVRGRLGASEGGERDIHLPSEEPQNVWGQWVETSGGC